MESDRSTKWDSVSSADNGTKRTALRTTDKAAICATIISTEHIAIETAFGGAKWPTLSQPKRTALHSTDFFAERASEHHSKCATHNRTVQQAIYAAKLVSQQLAKRGAVSPTVCSAEWKSLRAAVGSSKRAAEQCSKCDSLELSQLSAYNLPKQPAFSATIGPAERRTEQSTVR